MEALAEQLAHLRTQVAEALGAVHRSRLVHDADDAELTEAVALAGDLARLVDAVLIDGVAELAHRSRGRDVSERLTTRQGCHNLNELVRRLTLCSSQSAARLERAQRAVAPEWDFLTDEERPAPLPALRAAMHDGHIGVDGVLAASGPLLEMRDRVAFDRVVLADEVLAAHARGTGPDNAPPVDADLLRMHAQAWATALDQDGAEPAERDNAFRRGITFGRVRNGVIPLGGALLPDVAAQFQQIIAATSGLHARGVRFGDPDAAPDGSFEEGARILDDRTPAQKAHDAFALTLSVAARSGELPTVGGAAPTLVVSVRAEDLGLEHGWASAEGIDDPVTLNVARYVGCGGVIQRVALTATAASFVWARKSVFSIATSGVRSLCATEAASSPDAAFPPGGACFDTRLRRYSTTDRA